MGMLERPDEVDAMVTVSSQSGYWRVQGRGERMRALVMVAAVLPMMSRLLGYFPWSKLARGEDLPAGVAIEWSRWCRKRRYLLDDPTLPVDRYARFRAPILAYSVDDDAWGTGTIGRRDDVGLPQRRATSTSFPPSTGSPPSVTWGISARRQPRCGPWRGIGSISGLRCSPPRLFSVHETSWSSPASPRR
jgi:hypothetical protein